MTASALRAAAAAVLIWAGLPAPVLAADEKPAVAIKTRSIEASVTVAPETKAYPGLYDNLLAEGRREMAKRRAEADAELKDAPADFTDNRRHSFERKYTQRSVAGRFVSVLRSDYFYTLGAHPGREYNTILWDTDAAKRIGIRPLFKETADNGPALDTIAKAIRDALVAEKKKRGAYEPNDTGIASVKPKLLELAPLLLAPSTEPEKSSGLIVYFSPYMVGSYAEGDYTVFVPWTVFRTHLSPEGTAVFGGARPKDDETRD